MLRNIFLNKAKNKMTICFVPRGEAGQVIYLLSVHIARFRKPFPGKMWRNLYRYCSTLVNDGSAVYHLASFAAGIQIQHLFSSRLLIPRLKRTTKNSDVFHQPLFIWNDNFKHLATWNRLLCWATASSFAGFFVFCDSYFLFDSVLWKGTISWDIFQNFWQIFQDYA